MSPIPDPWEPWYSAFQQAYAGGDIVRIREALRSVRLDFHGQRHSRHDRWDALFSALVQLMANEDPDVRRLAYHYAIIVAEAEYGPPHEEDSRSRRPENLHRRTLALLPALTSKVNGEPGSLLRCVDDLASAERRVELGPQADVVRWFESLSSLSSPEQEKLATRLAYLHAREPWESVRSLFFEMLDHDDILVRAVAARSIGARYLDTPEDEISPPFKDVVEMVTEKELLRPGIAGPLLSSWYICDIEPFERCANIKIEEWICRILANRKSPESNTLPCSNGIDFFAHEIFGGRADYIRKLLELGYETLALEAATEVNEKVDDVEPILMDLGCRPDSEICRIASWHLAYHYRRLHPDGARRGFVRHVPLGMRAEMFINLSKGADQPDYPYSATIYPRGAAFTDDEAWKHVDNVLPASIRGEMVPFGMPGDGDVPGLYVVGKKAHCRYAHGAIVSFRFDGEVNATRWKYVEEGAKRWAQITIIWHGQPNAWNPEAELRISGK